MRFLEKLMLTLMKLARSIKLRRRLLKITQEDLAEVAGVSLRSLKDFERGKANPTWNQVAKIIEALGWEMDLKEHNA